MEEKLLRHVIGDPENEFKKAPKGCRFKLVL